MPVESNTVEYTYTGDGVSTVFPFPSLFLASGDILVGVNSVLQLSGYTVSGAGVPSGGSVTFTTAPAAAAKVVLLRKPPINQLIDFVSGQTVLEGVLDRGLDKLTMIAQYLTRAQERSVQVSELSGLDGPVLSDPVTGRALVWGADGNIVNSVASPDTTQADLDALEALEAHDRADINARTTAPSGSTVLAYDNSGAPFLIPINQLSTGSDHFDAEGSFAGRSAHDSSAPPFKYLVNDVDPMVYYQRNGASGNWLGPFRWSITDPQIEGAVFTPSGVTPRTVTIQTKLRERIAARDHCTADGAIDDAAALTRLLAAATEGAVINLDGRTVRLASNVALSKELEFSNGTLLFDHAGIGLTLAANKKFYADKVRFTSLGAKTAYVAGHIGLSKIGASAVSRAPFTGLTRCQFDGFGNCGMFLRFGDGALLDETDFSNCALATANFTSSDDVLVNASKFDMLGAIGNGVNAYGLVFTHTAVGYGADPNKGTPNATNPFPRGIRVEGNIILGPQLWEGLSVSHGVDGALLRGNRIFGARTAIIVGSDGDTALVSSRDVKIVENVVSGYGTDEAAAGGNSGLYGITIEGAAAGVGRIVGSGNIISKNTIENYTQAIVISRDPSMIAGNVVRKSVTFAAHAASANVGYRGIDAVGSQWCDNISENNVAANYYHQWFEGDCTAVRVDGMTRQQGPGTSIGLRPQATTGIVKMRKIIDLNVLASQHFQSPLANVVDFDGGSETVISVTGTGALVANLSSPVRINMTREVLVTVAAGGPSTLTFTNIVAGMRVRVLGLNATTVTINSGGNVILKGGAAAVLNLYSSLMLSERAGVLEEASRNI